ncbi:multidrug efflux MFS transporter [Streptomyces sp. HNM0575]|nr:multidrug efflux MFS transporter [Streptomyces sp. HNM0575]
MVLLDTTIVNVALDGISNALGASTSSIQWVATSYLLTLAVVIPLSGWASERLGTRRLWLIALVIFIAGSVLCGASWELGPLIAFRVLQGIGGGLISPVAMSIIAQQAGPQRLGRVMAVAGIPVLLMPVLGPLVGGAIVDQVSWRWIFYINVPIGVVAFWMAARVLNAPPRTGPSRVRLDLRGLVLLAPGLAAVLYGLSETQSEGGLGSSEVWPPLAGGAVLMALFVLHSSRLRQPRHSRQIRQALVDVKLFRRGAFSAAAASIFLVGGALLGASLIIPLYYQQGRGESPLSAGLLIAPQGVGSAMAMRFAGKFTDRVGGGPVASVGLLACTVASVPLAFVDQDTPYWWLIAVLFARGIGFGASLMPITSVVYKIVQPAEIPRATSIVTVLQQLGGALGTALLAVILQNRLAHTGGPKSGTAYAQTFTCSIALTFIALLATLCLTYATRRKREPSG